MKTLDLTRAEAIQVIEDDKKVDKGEKLFELTPEQKKVAKKMKNGARAAVNAYGKKVAVERKPDDAKRYLINLLLKTLNAETDDITDIEVTNIQRQMDFKYQGRKMRIVLSAPTK